MVWIESIGMPRQYFPEVVEARKKAVDWMEGSQTARDRVDFYEKKGSRKYYGYVLRENWGGKSYYYWVKYDRQFGVVQKAINKNGKIKR